MVVVWEDCIGCGAPPEHNKTCSYCKRARRLLPANQVRAALEASPRHEPFNTFCSTAPYAPFGCVYTCHPFIPAQQGAFTTSPVTGMLTMK